MPYIHLKREREKDRELDRPPKFLYTQMGVTLSIGLICWIVRCSFDLANPYVDFFWISLYGYIKIPSLKNILFCLFLNVNYIRVENDPDTIDVTIFNIIKNKNTWKKIFSRCVLKHHSNRQVTLNLFIYLIYTFEVTFYIFFLLKSRRILTKQEPWVLDKNIQTNIFI